MEFKVRNFNPIIAAAMKLNQAGGRRGLSRLGGSLLAGALLAAGSAAQAQTTTTAPPAPADESLTWHGITLYGIVDMDFQYETHGAPFSNYFISGGSDIVQKNSNNAVSGFTSNGMSQSRVGLQGKEPLHFMDWSAVFKLETYFNPASGQITDALKSVAQNNGRALDAQSTNIDSSIAGAAVRAGVRRHQLSHLGNDHLRPSELDTRGPDRQIRSAADLVCLLAARIVRHSGRRRRHAGSAPRQLDQVRRPFLRHGARGCAVQDPELLGAELRHRRHAARRSPGSRWRWVRSTRVRPSMRSTPRCGMRSWWAP